MTPDERKAIEERANAAKCTYVGRDSCPYQHRDDPADFMCTYIPTLLKALDEKDREIERLKELNDQKRDALEGIKEGCEQWGHNPVTTPGLHRIAREIMKVLDGVLNEDSTAEDKP